jgi:hypothetical protein
LASIHEKTCLNIRSAQSCSHERKTATAIGAFLPRPCLRLLDTYHRESAASTAQPIISRAFPRTTLPHLRPLSTHDSCLLLNARSLPPVLDRAIPRVEPASCDKILPKRALPAPFSHSVAASSSRPRGHTRRTRNRHLLRYHSLHPPKSRSRKNRRRLAGVSIHRSSYPWVSASGSK